MKKLLILLTLVSISCAQQMGTFKVSWDYNIEPDIYAYRIGLGISSDSSYSDSTQYLGFFIHNDMKQTSPDSALISVQSVLDGKWLFAYGTAIDIYSNESGRVYSNIVRKSDNIPPALLKFLFIRKQ